MKIFSRFSFKEMINKLLALDRSPKSIALSAGIGVFIAFSPYLGIHGLMALGVAYFFKLPMYPLVLGAYVTNPLTILPIYAFSYKVGTYFTDYSSTSIDWSKISFSQLLAGSKSMLVPFFIGTHILGLVFGVLAYFIIYYVVNKYKRKKNNG